MFPERWLAGNYKPKRHSRLNQRPNKHCRRLLSKEAQSRIVCNYTLGCCGRTTSWDLVVTRPEE
eukprot:8248186-Heterocapsa_arctica.AAC.1